MADTKQEMLKRNISKYSECLYEAPASELIVIDCKGAMMQAAISDWVPDDGGDFYSPFEGPVEGFDAGTEFVLVGASESN